MFILLFSLISYWTGTPITSLTNPDYRAYNTPYNYNNLQIGAGIQEDGLDIKLGGSYMLNEKVIITGHYRNQFLSDGDFPNGDDGYGTKFNQSDFTLGSLYRIPVNPDLDFVIGGDMSFDWYKDRDKSDEAENIGHHVDYEDQSLGLAASTGLRYSLAKNVDTGFDIGAKYAYDRTYLQTGAELNYYFTENIALGSRASFEDKESMLGFYIRISN
ncbi:MAG: hypothetical protein ACK5NC_04130 [Vibrio sp.]